jgi:hypothetical protein
MTRSAEAPLSSRRKFIAGLAVGAAALGAVAAPALNRSWFRKDARGSGGWWGRKSVALENGGLDEWSRHVGSAFAAKAENGTASLKLIAVKPLASAGERPDNVSRDRAFVAVFQPASAAPKGDRIYAVNHSVSGDMSIFFSPAAPNGHVEAVFN